MRVALVNQAADWGGGEGWTLRTAEGLAERGHGVLIVARHGSPLEQRARSAGVETVGVSVGIDYSPVAITRFSHLFRRNLTDVVLVHQNKDVRTAGVAAHRVGLKVVHRNGYPILKNGIRHRITTRFVDRILTNSRQIRDHYLGFGWLKTPIDLVYNGIVDPGEPARSDRLRSLASFQADQLVAFFAGRLTAVKRVDILLRAMAALPPESCWRLAIAGTGSEEHALRDLAERLELGERVAFLGFREDTAQLAAGADMALLASSGEGMPNALMEAMVRGVPVAATPVGDVPELLGDGSAGWLIPVAAVTDWSELLLRSERRREELRALGRVGRERVLAKYSFGAMLDGVERSLALAQRRPS